MERLPSISVHPYIEDTPMSTPSRRTSFHDTIMPDVEIQNTSNSSNTSSSIRQTNTVSSSSKSGSTDYFPGNRTPQYDVYVIRFMGSLFLYIIFFHILVDRPLMTTTTTITTTTIRPTPLQSSSMMGLGKQSQLLNPLPPSDDEDGTILNDGNVMK
ncbi:hypothetical protein BDA99DRAFT_524448 [Phascolomyces articulosus]|uniref:Uncharacterized protein n=1 Tax=Phascolomyces articulosus TaxID=60185 RepID=A0AAD5P8S7_9FUNG|nr:hypothetical protein BDA99DRAFT_524448 [Phascolomyces articulosus]